MFIKRTSFTVLSVVISKHSLDKKKLVFLFS